MAGKKKASEMKKVASWIPVIFCLLVLFSGCNDDTTYSITGQATWGGVPLTGVTMTLTGGPSAGVTVTDASGNYAFNNVAVGNYTLTPSVYGFSFAPMYRNVYINGISASGFNFAARGPVKVSASNHTLSLKSDSTIWAWGSNSSGQLGIGTTTDSSTAVQVSQASGLSYATSVSAGLEFSMAVDNSGNIWAWGSNTFGQIGDGTTIDRWTPVQVSQAGGLTGVTAVSAGYTHAVALRNDGTVWTWGDNSSGQLGNGTTTGRATPIQVNGLSSVIAIAAGYDHTIVLKKDGTIWTWGGNSYGQLGNGSHTASYTPIQAGLSGVSAIAAGYQFTAVVRIDAINFSGLVFTWGINDRGQLGYGTTTNNPNPGQVAGVSGIVSVACGYQHTVLAKTDGTVWAWGANSNGQLGLGTTTDSYIPAQTAGLVNVDSAAAGQSHTVAVKTDRSIWAWGGNSFGQVGDGTTIDRWTPVQVQ